MAWLLWGVVAAVAAALIRPLWAGYGPPWRWPARMFRAVRRWWRRTRQSVSCRFKERRRRRRGDPDPLDVLRMQRRLGVLAAEIQALEATGADSTYWARAHRIRSRQTAYDQLLIEACVVAGVTGCRPSPGIPGQRNEQERFRVEMELAARGWSW